MYHRVTGTVQYMYAHVTQTVGVHFFLDTPTVRPLLPVVLVCCPLTRRLGERGDIKAVIFMVLYGSKTLYCRTGFIVNCKFFFNTINCKWK